MIYENTSTDICCIFIRLYARGAVLGYKRSNHRQHAHTALLKVEGVHTKEDADFYVGKRVAYVYNSKNKGGVTKSAFHKRVIWGKVIRQHGSSGVVRAKFQTNIPPSSIGKAVRVMLYPSRI
jgi:large subunit ribosomal protein L35Ae